MDILHPFHHDPLHPKPVEPEAKPMSTTPAPVVASTTVAQKLAADAKKFVSILDMVGKDAEWALSELVKYAVPVASLVSLIFPAAAPEATGTVVALNLIQNAVLEVKAKSAALPTNLTPAQMLADELQLVGPAVTSLLASEKITVNSAQVENIIQAVVAILNTQPAPVAA
jgi:hypothetical protein